MAIKITFLSLKLCAANSLWLFAMAVKNKKVAAVILRRVDDCIGFDVSVKLARANNISFSSAMLELALTAEGLHD